jgi:hypothetical protein
MPRITEYRYTVDGWKKVLPRVRKGRPFVAGKAKPVNIK